MTSCASSAASVGIDPATATTLILGMHRQMKPATLLSLLPYAYPAALAGLMNILQQDAAASSLSPSDATSDTRKDTTTANSTTTTTTTTTNQSNNGDSAYLQALAQSPVYSLTASLSTALLDTSIRPLAQSDNECNDTNGSTANSDTTAASNASKAKTRQNDYQNGHVHQKKN
ncbi:hypothetical protein BDF19DRAFT_297262 [Syncephalis fuscata]|nr:hypothetical protein BDF19DRAFT_297262 [Syncephalis fuscata]